MLNQGLSRYKQSRIEKVVNKICIYLIVAQAILCIIMSVYSGFYVSNYASMTTGGVMHKAEYIFYTGLTSFGSSSQNSTDVNSADIEYNNPIADGFITYGMYFILLNALIPISLVVSIEFIKLTQAPFIANDIQMYDEETMKQAQPMSMTLHEEMASIKYIFADKTGTLTANIMQFKACTVGSVCYDEEYRDEDYEYEMGDSNQSVTPQSDRNNEENAGLIQEEDINEKRDADDYRKFKERNASHFNEPGQESKIYQRRNSITKIIWNFNEAEQIIKNLLEKNRYFVNEETNLGQSQRNGPSLTMKKQNEYLHQFWLNVSLCHDVITTLNQSTNQLTYQGTSPDEITLLDAAKELGYQFLDRNSESMKISIFGKEKSYRLLQKFEFTSDRKKMSVVVQDEKTQQIIVFSKGADLAIFERLSTQIEQHFLDATKEDLIKFSTKGFRTLCFAMRVLDEDYFKQWQLRFEAAKVDQVKLGVQKQTAQSSKKALEQNPIAVLQSEIESNLFLLGATALEDKLQDGVPEAIEDFRNAGIKVWMLTGDKLETAENIGFSSKMFNEKMFIFKLQTGDKASTRSRLAQIDQRIFQIEKQNATPIIGTQFILNPNAGTEYEAKNIIRALEEFKHESRPSECTLNDSWARKPALRRKVRKRLEEIVPDKNAIADRLVQENQIFYNSGSDQLQYIPRSFDMNAHQYIVRRTNVFRSTASQKLKEASSGIHLGKINLSIQNEDTNGIIDNEDKFGILIEGHTLAFIQDSKSMKEKFLNILSKCEAVIVCRASPSQKGQVVQMIKTSEPDVVTLAIGDGANDVNMIQRAHIGIGIFGKEGYQAASNSDYAIGQFKFLRRLLFVHGRWNGVRLTIFMLLFFNKNIVYTMPQFWFGWNNGFSGQTYYDDIYMSCFNLFATNIAVCALAVWEIDIKIDGSKKSKIIDLFLPQIYKYSQDNEIFSTKKFFAWGAVSVLQSLFMYGIPQLAYGDFLFSGGMLQDFWAQSVCSYYAVVILHYVTVFYYTNNWTWHMTMLYFVSFLFFVPFVVVIYDNYSGTPIEGRLYEIVFSNFQFWLTVAISVAVCMVPIASYTRIYALMFPSLKDLLLQNSLNSKEVIDEADPQKAKQTMDMFKQHQTQALAKWDSEYNSFQPITQNNTHPQTRESQLTPRQKLITPAKNEGRAGVQLEQIPEELKEGEYQESAPFELAPEIKAQINQQTHKELTSPMRNSQPRKGLSKHQHSGSLQPEPFMKQNMHQSTVIRQTQLSSNDDIPLRISRSRSPKKSHSIGFALSPTLEQQFDNEAIEERKEKNESSENLFSEGDLSIAASEKLDQKMKNFSKASNGDFLSQAFSKSFAQRPPKSVDKSPSKLF